jgi:ubiquinone/menaquinone biosynthesis C-methylase UbiE
MSVTDLFSDASDRYAAARPQYPRELYQFLASLLDQRQRVWDCGAGNGQAAAGLANFFAEVYATDVSEQQIEHAIAHPKVIYSIQPAEATQFPDQFFDAVTVAQALHWFNFDQFWPEVKRVLKVGGVFAAWGYDWPSVSLEVDQIINTEIRDVILPFWAPQIRHLWAKYQDLDFPFTPIETPAFQIQLSWTLSDLLDYLSTWSATRQCIQHQGDEFFRSAQDHLAKVWGGPHEQRTVTMNLHPRFGRNEE